MATEPGVTIHSQTWREARDRLATLDAGTRPVFLALLDHVEAGWRAFRPLQEWLQNRDDTLAELGDYAHLLGFVEGELSDVFMLIGSGVADLVPGWPGWEAKADPTDVAGCADSFEWNLAVFRLACAGADVPEPFRRLALSVARVLETGEWSEQLSALLGPVGELVPNPLDERQKRRSDGARGPWRAVADEHVVRERRRVLPPSACAAGHRVPADRHAPWRISVLIRQASKARQGCAARRGCDRPRGVPPRSCVQDRRTVFTRA